MREDIELLFQKSIKSKIKIELLNSRFETIDTLQNALISDSLTIDADSDMRRTYEGNFYVKDPSFFIGENKKIWTDKYIRVWKGKVNDKTNETVWYNLGIYLFNDTSYTYNETTKQLTISCVDMMSKFNNTFGGQISGAYSFHIPCEEEITEVVNKTGEFAIISENRKDSAGAKVSIGTNLIFSLFSPSPSIRYKYSEFQGIELCFANVRIFDTSGNIVSKDDVKMKLSIDDRVQARSPDNNNITVFNIDKSKINQNTHIGVLQNISFSYVFIRFLYVEVETENDEIVNRLDPFTVTVRWYFKDSNFYKSCLPAGTLISGNMSKTLTQTESDDDVTNTLKIDTSERAVTDTVTKPVSWYSSVIDTITDLGGISDYIVEHTDETIPYDLEFQTGTSVYDILKQLVDLRVNWEMFFDIKGILRIQPVPSLYEDDIIIPSEYFSPLVLSEANKDSFSKIRNITEVWGMNIDASYYTDVCKTSKNGYNAEFSDLVFTDEIRIPNNTIIGIKVNSENIENPAITVTANKIDITTESSERVSTEPVTVYTSSGDILEAGVLRPNTSYCFKYYKGKFYYMGQFQVHGMCIETKKEPADKEKEENKKKYNCENIYYSVEPDSPYCVEKIGERIQVLSGDDYDNIYSDQLAVERAKWENWKTTRRQDAVTLEMIDIPWLDVNSKVEYTSYIDGETHQYIVKSINGSASEGTMTVELMRFYPLYILDAKKYEAVNNLKKYEEYIISTSSYITEDIVKILNKLLEDGINEIYMTENTDDIKTVLNSYKNKMDNVTSDKE